MSELIINNILIADIDKKKACSHSFIKGLNIVSGSDNHVGKSTLLKSIYHTMGADVKYGEIWGIGTKLFVLDFMVDDVSYRICRFSKSFIVFKGEELVLFTDNVSTKLAQFMASIFSFGVYLNDKNTKRVVLAPPAFTYLPYYIDQDSGWDTLYGSFERLAQFSKGDRLNSLLFHLNVYTKDVMEMIMQRDTDKARETEIKKEIEDQTTVVSALTKETEGIVPAENIEQLEQNLQQHTEAIRNIVARVGRSRNRIQELKLALEQHIFQQKTIKGHIAVEEDASDSRQEISHSCPRCGYLFDEEIYERVHSQFSNVNDSYIQQYLAQVIEAIRADLQKENENYLGLCDELSNMQSVFNEETDGLEVYMRHCSLRKSIASYNEKIASNTIELRKLKSEIRKISVQLGKLPNREDVEAKYIEATRLNIIRLGAWDAAYDGKIHLLEPIKAQGTLDSKIILSQFIGLFQTMDYFKCQIIRFPFVVDSPRGKEASKPSSKEILTMIAQIKSLPQIILATTDFDDFKDELHDVTSDAKIITLTEQYALLNEAVYTEHADEIEEIATLFSTLSQKQ